MLRLLRRIAELAEKEGKKIEVWGPYDDKIELLNPNESELLEAVREVWPFCEMVDMSIMLRSERDRLVVEVWTPHM